MFKSEKFIMLKTNALNEVIKACINQLNEKKRLHFIIKSLQKLN